jgi:hypothetical protein
MCLRKHVKYIKDRGNTTAFNNAALTARVNTKSANEILRSWDRAQTAHTVPELLTMGE